jgi:hypothetical protein
MKFLFSLLIIGLIFFFDSCKKENYEVDYQAYTLPELGAFRTINYIDSGWMLSGGNIGEEGFVIKSNIEFNDFKVVSDSLEWPVYDLIYYSNRYIYSADKAEIYFKKPGLPVIRPYYPPEEYWINTLNKKTLWQIEETPNMGLYIAGGGDYAKGVILYSFDKGKNWIPYELENEMRSVSFQPPNTIWSCGYGLLIKTHDFVSGWETVPFENEFFTGIDFFDANVGLLSTFKGKIYRTSDGGVHWNEVLKTKGITGGLSINKIRFLNKNLAVAIGNNGYIAVSSDSGNSWKTSSNFNEINLYDMAYIEGWLYLVGDASEVYKLLL